MASPCTATCFIALVIVVAMVIMSLMVSNGTYLGSNGTYLGSNGTYLGSNGTYLGSNGTYLGSNDSSIKNYRNQLPPDIQKEYDRIVAERQQIYFTGYGIGFVVALFWIVFSINVLKHKIPISAMVCMAVVVSTVVNYFYYILSPKSNYMIELLKTDQQRQEWLQAYKSMQYYYHLSFVLGAVAVGVFAYAFRGKCS